MDHLFNGQIPHKPSMGHLFRCGSLVLLSGPTQVLYGSLVSMWIIYSSLIRSHTSPLWVACFGVDHLFFSYQVSHKPSMGRLCFGVDHLFFSYQVPHKPSMGHLFRCGSSLLLSGLTQVLYGPLVLFSMCTCACVCVCMCIESLCREITPPATLLQWEVKVIFVFVRMPLTRLSKCFASSCSGAIDLALRLHSIAVTPVIDPHSP